MPTLVMAAEVDSIIGHFALLIIITTRLAFDVELLSQRDLKLRCGARSAGNY